MCGDNEDVKKEILPKQLELKSSDGYKEILIFTQLLWFKSG
jgi:hypothetical protein